jgi:group I intron endonuclease
MMYDATNFNYTPYTNEAPTVLSGPMPLANTALGDADMVDEETTRKLWFVYRVTCIVSGKDYIGLTNRGVDDRWRLHLWQARTGRKKGAFQHAINKYGPDAFVREVLFVAFDEEAAIMAERQLIVDFQSGVPNGYNLTSGGETYKGFTNFAKRPVSEEHKEHLRRLAAAMKGKPRNRDSVERGRAKLMGHAVSEITRQRIGAKSRGRKPSESTRKKIGDSSRGIALSDEVKARMSASMKQKWADPVAKAERLEKTRLAHEQSGYSHSENMRKRYQDNPELRLKQGAFFEAHKEKMIEVNRAAMKQRWTDPEYRQKQAAQLKARNERLFDVKREEMIERWSDESYRKEMSAMSRMSHAKRYRGGNVSPVQVIREVTNDHLMRAAVVLAGVLSV